jgi:thiol-disulfide isomerase/thioredoxin
MNSITRPSLVRFYAMLMIGTGLVTIGIVLLMILKNSGTAPDDFSAIPAQVDFASPKLALEDLSGRPVSLDDYLGSIVLVNLWATWCPPCKEEMPTLQEFYETYRSDGFVLVAINQEESREVVAPFVEEFGLTFPVWLDLKYQAEKEFKTESLPSSFLIDRSGRVRLMWFGGISKKNLEKYVADIIKE